MNYTCNLYQFLVHVACGRGFIFLQRWRCTLLSDCLVESGLALVWQVSTKTSCAHNEPNSAASGNVDFESLVLMRLRQAEERKRLNQQMKAEDE